MKPLATPETLRKLQAQQLGCQNRVLESREPVGRKQKTLGTSFNVRSKLLGISFLWVDNEADPICYCQVQGDRCGPGLLGAAYTPAQVAVLCLNSHKHQL